MEMIGDGKKHYATVQQQSSAYRSTTYTVTLANFTITEKKW